MNMVDLLPAEGTKGRILEELMTGPRSAKELAGVLRIRESAVRTHLERLVDRGIVQPSFHRQGVGRPRKRFSLTPDGQEIFPRRYEMLLDALIGALEEREGEGYVSSLMVQAAQEFARKVAQKLPAFSPETSKEDRLRAVVKVLNDLGQRAELNREGERLQVVRKNCVFRATAMKHAYLLCNVFDQHFLENLFGQAGVDLLDSIPRGAHSCTHLIQLGSH